MDGIVGGGACQGSTPVMADDLIIFWLRTGIGILCKQSEKYSKLNPSPNA